MRPRKKSGVWELDPSKPDPRRSRLFYQLYVTVNEDGELFYDLEKAGRYLAREVLNELRRNYKYKFEDVKDTFLRTLKQMIEDIKRGKMSNYYKNGKLLVPGFLKDLDIDLVWATESSRRIHRHDELDRKELLYVLHTCFDYFYREYGRY